MGDLRKAFLDDQTVVHTVESEGRRDLPQILVASLSYLVLVLFVSFILGFMLS